MPVDDTRRRFDQGSPFEQEIGYVRAVADSPWAWVSGTTGYDYATMTISPDVPEQADQAMRNIAAALDAVGFRIADIVRVRYLVTSREDFPPCWPVLRRWFAEAPPAATMHVCGLTDDAMRIEIEVTAYRP